MEKSQDNHNNIPDHVIDRLARFFLPRIQAYYESEEGKRELETERNNAVKEKPTMSKKLVAYFSASGVTAGVAKVLAETLAADLYEIAPQTPYTDADLDWRDANSRSSLEMKDKSSRPEIADTAAHAADYDVILLGFPIWWYIAPTIVNTFLEKYDFSGKKIILFATSGGSGFGETVTWLKGSVAENTVIAEGMLQKGRQDVAAWKTWAIGLGI